MDVRMIDVARKAGVSKSTVSQYLNGHYEYMGLDTRERIKQAIDQLGFVPNALARGLRMKRSFTIAAIVANILNPFSTSVIRGAEDCCKKYGFDLILCNADDNPEKEKEYIDNLLAKQVDGFIISTTEQNNAWIHAVNQKTPVVICGRNVPETGCDTVRTDNYAVVKVAIDHLVSLGHKHIAMYVQPNHEVNISPRRERAQAFRAVMQEYSLPFCDDWLIEIESDEDLLTESVLRLLGHAEHRPTAFIGANDLMTIGLFRVLKKLRISIPGEAALLGFDDWEWATLLEPPITVVAQPTYEMGYMAAELVVKRIREEAEEYHPHYMVYQPELIPRQSCGE